MRLLCCAAPAPYNHQLASELRAQRFDEFDDLSACDRAAVQPEHEARAGETGAGLNALLAEVVLNDRRVAPGRPGTHPRGALREARFVDEADQSPFCGSLFLSASQVLRFQLSSASSLRSMARRSDFSELDPKAPSYRQTCTSMKATPDSRSMRAHTRLSVQSSGPNLCASGPCCGATRKPLSWAASNSPAAPWP